MKASDSLSTVANPLKVVLEPYYTNETNNLGITVPIPAYLSASDGDGSGDGSGDDDGEADSSSPQLAGFKYVTYSKVANQSYSARTISAIKYFPLKENGDFVLTEEEVYGLGIECVTTFQLYSWKNMQEDAVDYANQQIIVRGYSDSNFETQRTIRVTTQNHLDGFRQTPLELPATNPVFNDGSKQAENLSYNDKYIESRTDSSLIFVSKMYYDTVSRAGYADVDSGEPITDKTKDPINESIFEKVSGGKMTEEAAKDAIEADARGEFTEVEPTGDFADIEEKMTEAEARAALAASATTTYIVDDPVVKASSLKYPEGTVIRVETLGTEEISPEEKDDEGNVTKPAEYATRVRITVSSGMPADNYVYESSEVLSDVLVDSNGDPILDGNGKQQAQYKKGTVITAALLEVGGKQAYKAEGIDGYLFSDGADGYVDASGAAVTPANTPKPVVSFVISLGLGDEEEPDAPDFSAIEGKMTEADARTALAAMGLTVEATALEEYSDTVAAGTVIRVETVTGEGGSSAAVRLVVSKGKKPEDVKTPEELEQEFFATLFEKTEGEARTALVAEGYTVDPAVATEKSDYLLEGKVIRIDKDVTWTVVDTPAQGTEGEEGYVPPVTHTETGVRIVVSGGLTDKAIEAASFGDYINGTHSANNKNIAAVRAALEADGYTVVKHENATGDSDYAYEYSDGEDGEAGVPEGEIIRIERTNPEDGYESGAVKKIQITVSLGISPEQQRNQLFAGLQGKDPSAAWQELTDAGYEVEEAYRYEASETIAAGKVLCVDLVSEAGTDESGSATKAVVALIVSTGNGTGGGTGGGDDVVVDVPLYGEEDYDSWNILKGTAQTQRFTNYTSGSNDSHHYGHNGCWGSSRDENEGTINIGYKGIGSFLTDFRQVDTTPGAAGVVTTVQPEGTSYMEQGYSNLWNIACPGTGGWPHWSTRNTSWRHIYGSTTNDATGNLYNTSGNTHYESVGSVTYNTGANLKLTQSFNTGAFDAYYVKIRQQALKYINAVTVNYKNGSSFTVSGTDIRREYYNSLRIMDGHPGKATSVQVDEDGYYYFRLNLLQVDKDGNSIVTNNPTASFGVNQATAYKDTFAEYVDEADINPVTSVVYDVTINQGTEVDDGTGVKSVSPDYGQWFAERLSNANTWMNDMSFEVTGRFYKSNATVTSTTDVAMTIGGDYAGTEGKNYKHKAAQRYDAPTKRADGHAYEEGRGTWSYKNYHRTGGCCYSYSWYYGTHHYHYWTFDEGKMRHLRTTCSFNVFESRNFLKKTFSKGGTSWTDPNYLNNPMSGWVLNDGTEGVGYASDQQYLMSLYRETPGYDSTGYGNSNYQLWGGYSAADNMTITDVLPTVYPDADTEYFGFVGTGLKFRNGSGVATHLNPDLNSAKYNVDANFQNVFVKINTARWVEDADNPVTRANFTTNTGYKRAKDADRTFVVRESATFEMKPVTLEAAYELTGTLDTVKVNSSGLRIASDDKVVYYDKNSLPVEKAAAGTKVYTETMVNTVEDDPVLTLAPTTDTAVSQGLEDLFRTGLDKNGDAVIYFQRAYDHAPEFMDATYWNYEGNYVPNYKKNDDGSLVLNSKDKPAVVRTDGGTGRTSTLVLSTAEATKAHAPLTFHLPDGEMVVSYQLNLGPYGGDADATAETARIYDGDKGTASTEADYAVMGRPYIYHAQVNKLYNYATQNNVSANGGAYEASTYLSSPSATTYGYSDYRQNATNNATVSYSHFYDDDLTDAGARRTAPLTNSGYVGNGSYGSRGENNQVLSLNTGASLATTGSNQLETTVTPNNMFAFKVPGYTTATHSVYGTWAGTHNWAGGWNSWTSSGTYWLPADSSTENSWMVGYKIQGGYATTLQTESDGRFANTLQRDAYGNMIKSAGQLLLNGGISGDPYAYGPYSYNLGWGYTTPVSGSMPNWNDWVNPMVPSGSLVWTNQYAHYANSTSHTTFTADQSNLWRVSTDGTSNWSMHSNKSASSPVSYYGWNYTRTDNNQDLYSDSVAIVDYKSDNMTPNKATYEVRFRNRVDGNSTAQDANTRAAHLSEITLRSVIDTNYTGADRAKAIFRLQNLYVPVNLVASGVCDPDCEECQAAAAAGGADSTKTAAELIAQAAELKAAYDTAQANYDALKTAAGTAQRDLDAAKAAAEAARQAWQGVRLVALYAQNAEDSKQLMEEAKATLDALNANASSPENEIDSAQNLYDAALAKYNADKAMLDAAHCPGEHLCTTCAGEWFQVVQFMFKYIDANGAEQVKYVTWDQLVEDGRVTAPLKADGTLDADGDYAIDLEGYLRNSYVARNLEGALTVGSVGRGLHTYEPFQNSTDPSEAISYPLYDAIDETNTINGYKDDPTVNLTYAKPIITEVQLAFEAPNANRRFPETMLDSGQWLSRPSQKGSANNPAATATAKGDTYQMNGSEIATDAKGNKIVTQWGNYAFKYDGTFVDRTYENFTKAQAATIDPDGGNWDYTSTPTFGKQANDYRGEISRHELKTRLGEDEGPEL